MKKILFILVSLIMSVSMFAKINEPKIVQENGTFVITNVVMYDTISANVLYDNVRTILSDITLEDKSKNMIDYANNETHTIVLKGKLYIGASKKVMGGPQWDVFLNYITTIKIKNNKLQCSSKFTTYTFTWSAGEHSTFDISFGKCYPEWNLTKEDKKSINKHYYESAYEKAIKPNTENSIIKYQMFICDKLNNINTEDDF